MNTTKLHIIATDLLSELSRTNTVSLLQKSIQALQQQIAQPQQPNFQQQLSNNLGSLYSVLESSPVENYSPAWRDALVELRVSEEFGLNLSRKIRNIFERNQITLQTALDEMISIQKGITDTENNLKGLVVGLNYFGVGEDELEGDECEVGLIVPREFVKDNMKTFGLELVQLEKMLLVFSELVTGEREPLKIRQISSSELSVFLQYAPEIAACVAVAVERIVSMYKQLLEIKKTKLELVRLEVPEEQLSGIDTHAKSIVAPSLEQLAKELIEEYGDNIEDGRKNEITIELKYSLNRLANRIDRGLNIELRVRPLEQEETDEENQRNNATEKAIAQIIESGSKINHLEHSGEPVLFLTENPGDEKQ